MKRIIMMLTLAALLVAALTVSAAGAFAAPKACSAGDPGCKTDVTATQPAGASGGFTETETQRGNTSAKGTTSTETTQCRNPGGQDQGGICR
jgi:ABC-type glycerol-3-phosphate transport system substrate-binding protein